MTTEEDYNKISNAVYNVDSSKIEVPLAEGKTILGGKYKVLQVEDSTDKDEQQIKHNENILSSFFMLSYVWLLICLYSWNGSIVMFISIFTFGLPLLLYGFPFLSIVMLGNKKHTVIVGYLSSLTSIFYLVFALVHYPLKKVTDEAGNEMTLSAWHSFTVITSIIIFLIMSTLLLYYKISHRRNL
ncbi:hypothetical protein ACVR1G_00745 [Streptococcus dentasini]